MVCVFGGDWGEGEGMVGGRRRWFFQRVRAMAASTSSSSSASWSVGARSEFRAFESREEKLKESRQLLRELIVPQVRCQGARQAATPARERRRRREGGTDPPRKEWQQRARASAAVVLFTCFAKFSDNV